MPNAPTLTIEQITSPVEIGQSVLIGYVTAASYDPLVLTQSEGAGSVTLGLVFNGVQGIYYTAPASAGGLATDTIAYTVQDRLGLKATVPATTIRIDPGPTYSPEMPTTLESGQTTVLAILTPGLPGDVLSLIDGPPGMSLGAVGSNGTQLLAYTAPPGVYPGSLQTLNYIIADQNGVGNYYTSVVQLDGGPVITAIAAGDVENNQTVIIGSVAAGLAGDMLTLTQSSGSLGIVTLGAVMNGVQAILYTAPAHVISSALDSVHYSISDQHQDIVATGSANVQLDRGVVITQGGSVTIAKGQSIVVDTVTAGLPGDTVTLVQTVAGLGFFTLVETLNGGSTQPNQYDVVYTETGGFTASQRDTAAYTVSDGIGGKPAGDTPYIRLDAGPALTAVAPAAVVKGQSTIIGSVTPGFAGDVDTLRQTGSGSGTVTLVGNKVVYTAAANVSATTTDTVSYTVTNQAGSSVSATSSVKVLGAVAIDSNAPIALAGGGHFIDLSGGSPTITFIGANNVAYLEGTASPTIVDDSVGLKVDMASANLSAVLKNVGADSSFVVDLLNGVGGFTTAAAARAALVSDGHGGALLSLPGGSGSIDFAGLAPASISASHFKIG